MVVDVQLIVQEENNFNFALDGGKTYVYMPPAEELSLEKLGVRPSEGGPICTCDAFRGTQTCVHVCFLFLKYRGGSLPVNLQPIGTPNHFYGRFRPRRPTPALQRMEPY